MEKKTTRWHSAHNRSVNECVIFCLVDVWFVHDLWHLPTKNWRCNTCICQAVSQIDSGMTCKISGNTRLTDSYYFWLNNGTWWWSQRMSKGLFDAKKKFSELTLSHDYLFFSIQCYFYLQYTQLPPETLKNNFNMVESCLKVGVKSIELVFGFEHVDPL